MSDFTLDDVKRLRELTGVGITDAKQALVESKGDFDAALSAMRKKGLTKAEKRGEREARAGLVGTYNHDGRIGVLVEVNCETDFVAKTDEFKELVKDLCMHVVASNPEFVSADAVSGEAKSSVEAEFIDKTKAEGKSADMVAKIVEGQLAKYFAERCLMDQPFIKNPDLSVDEYVKGHIAKLGENIIVRRIVRFELGETS